MLEVLSRIEGHRLYIEIHGVMDFATIGSFNERVNLKEIEEVVLDFSQMEFIDSTGIGAILELIYTAHENSVSVEFKGLREIVRELFETVGVFQIAQALKKGG